MPTTRSPLADTKLKPTLSYQVLDVNLRAPAIITREVVRLMLQQDPLPSLLEKEEGRPAGTCTRRGVIINMGSSASLRARSHAGAPYIASKHGLLGLTKVSSVGLLAAASSWSSSS